jgi:acyl carrier protein
VAERARQLAARLATLTGVDVTTLPTGLETPLRGLGIDSLVFVDFLVRTEKEYGFEWDEETPPEAFETLATMARQMFAEPAGAGAGRGGPGCS